MWKNVENVGEQSKEVSAEEEKQAVIACQRVPGTSEMLTDCNEPMMKKGFTALKKNWNVGTV